MIRGEACAGRTRHREGFTLVEVVVVTGIILLMAALLLTGIQSTREAARRTMCRNNLRQIATGTLNWSTRHDDTLPPGIDERGYSFLVSILPDLEAGPLHLSLNFDLGNGMFVHRANITALTVRISTYVCPSESPPLPMGTAWTNYAGNRGVAYQLLDRFNGPFGGVFSPTVRLGDIRDGTSFTVLAAEWMVGTPEGGRRHPVRSVLEAPELFLPSQYEAFLHACAGMDVAHGKLSVQRKGFDWMHGELGRSLYNHDMNINGKTCTNGGLIQQGAWTASSAHRGGVHLVFVDGHATYLRNAIPRETWHALGSMNGNESANNFQKE